MSVAHQPPQPGPPQRDSLLVVDVRSPSRSAPSAVNSQRVPVSRIPVRYDRAPPPGETVPCRPSIGFSVAAPAASTNGSTHGSKAPAAAADEELSAVHQLRTSAVPPSVGFLHQQQQQQQQPAVAVASSPTTLERRMDSSVETVFREWDSGLRSKTETTLAVRPLSSPGQQSTAQTASTNKDRRQRSQQQPSSPNFPPPATECDRDASSERRRPTAYNSEAIQSDDARKTNSSVKGDVQLGGSGRFICGFGRRANYSSGEESFDDGSAISRTNPDTSSHSAGSTCASVGGSKMTSQHPGVVVGNNNNFHVEFDADGYQPSDVTVRVAGGRLIVHGVRQEVDGGRRSTTEFCRKIRLPDDIDVAQLSCHLGDGRVVVDAPKLVQTNGVAAAAPSRPNAAASDPPLNVPVVRGDQLTLAVEVGRVFRADDVVVKVRNSTSTLTVSAERVETTADGGARLNASLAWQFNLPAPVDVESLRAGLTLDGLLRVTAKLQCPADDCQPVVAVVSE